jgi:hypothetical protein
MSSITNLQTQTQTQMTQKPMLWAEKKRRSLGARLARNSKLQANYKEVGV